MLFWVIKYESLINVFQHSCSFIHYFYYLSVSGAWTAVLLRYEDYFCYCSICGYRHPCLVHRPPSPSPHLSRSSAEMLRFNTFQKCFQILIEFLEMSPLLYHWYEWPDGLCFYYVWAGSWKRFISTRELMLRGVGYTAPLLLSATWGACCFFLHRFMTLIFNFKHL